MNYSNYKFSELTEQIIREARFVHNYLGYGFLEKVYERAVLLRLHKAGLQAVSQYPINIYFEKICIGEYFADILVESKIILELKAVNQIIPIHEVQLVNYLKATNIEVGLLINFGEKFEVRRKIFSKEYKYNLNS